MKTIFYLTILSLFGLFVLQCSTGSAGNNKNTVQNMTANKNIAPAQPGDDAPRIALADAKKNFDDGTALFVDTHGKAAYDAEHIKGSINISGENFEAEYSKLPKDKKIIAYCS